MDKSSVVNQFTNYVDQLRTQECSQKEKINCFQHIAECILSPAMVSHINYATHCSNATSVLLLFCEDLDSVVRMSAEENLNRIFRSLEKNRVKRILMDLYGEIKKNGNQRSLRICLNLFSYYAPLIKEKHISSYALRLLPCLQTIAQRKETQLCETLCEFIKSFAKYLQMGLNDSETCKLFDAFIANIGSECAVKRRCSSQNCISLIENSRNRSLMAKHALNKAIDILLGDDHQNTNNLLGTLGFLRILLPLIIREDSKGANIYRRSNSSNSSCGSNNKSDETWYIQDAKQIIEIYDFCLHLLSTNHTSNHSIINASLEVINSILQSLDGTETSAAGKTLEHLLCNHQLQHNEYLRKRKSLKNQIFQLKNFQMTCNLSAVGGTRSCGSGGVRKSGGIPAVPVAMSKVTSSPMRTANVEAEQRRCWMPAALRQASSPNSSESLLGTGDGNGNGDGGGGASEWNKHKTTRMTTTRMTAAAVATATAVTAVTRGKSPVEEIVRDAFKLGMEKTLSLSLEESCHPTPPPRRHHNQQQYQHQQSGMHHHPNARTSISRSRSSSSSSAIFDAKYDDSQRYGNGNAKVNNKKNSSSSGISVDEVAGCTVVSPTSTSTSTPANDELQLKNHKDDQHHHRIIDDDDDNDNGNDNEDEDDEDGFTTLLEVNEPLQDDSHLSLSSSKEFLPPSTALISAGTKTPIATTVTIDVNLLIEDDEDAEGEGGLGGCAAADGGSCDDKSQFLSDIDNESFNSIDFESEITIGGSSGIGSGVSGEHDNNNSDNKDAESTSRVIPSSAGGAPSSSSLSSSLLRRTTTATGSVNSSGVGSIGGGSSSKSSDTIGSFFNNLLSHSSAESMTKLFRSTPKPIPLPPVTDTTQVPATINSPQSKTQQQQQQQQQEDADNLSLESINSHISLGSHVSLPTNSSSSRNEQDLVMVAHHSASGTGTVTGNSNGNGNGIATTSGTASAVVNDDALSSASATASTALLMDNTNTRNTSDGSDDDDEGESSVTKSQQHEVDMDMDMDMDMGSGADIEQPMQLNIGTIYDQAIIYYTSRLIVVKFLLTGQRGGLQSDTTIRVSIKHLSLNVIAHCARLMPDILRLPVEISAAEIRRTQLALQIPEEDEQLTTGHSSNNSSDTSSSSNVGKDFDHLTDECRSEEFPQLGEFEAGNLLPLEIKDDHFGVSTTNDFLNQPLSRSADPLLLFAELGAGTTKHQEKSPKLKRSHKRAEQILSKSEIIESKTSRNSGRGSGSQVKGALPAAPTVVDGLQPITSQLRDISIGKSAAEKFNLVNKQTGNVDIHIPGSGIGSGSGSGSGNGNDTFPGTGIGIGIYDINQMQQEIHQQILSDVLLFYSHSDPILRGDVQIIIGNFVQSTLGFYHNRNELFDVEVSDGDGYGNVGGNRERSRTTCLRSPLEINRLLAILIKGLQDDIHTVVIHALNAFDKIFPLWMSKYLTATYKQRMTTTTTTTKTATTMCDSRKSHQQLPDATNDDVGTPDTSNDTGMSNGSSQKQDLQHLLYADDDTLLEDLLKCFKFDHKQSIETSSTMMATAATTTTNTTTAVLVSALASALNEKVNCAMETGPQPSTSADRNHYYGGQVDRELFIISPKLLLSKLRLCYHNKYWLVLNKYAEVISNLDYGAIREHYGNDMASTYENTFLDELLQLVGDDDFRVREHTADCLCRFIIQISGNRCRRRRQHEHSPRSRTTTATTVTSTTTTPAGRFAMSSEEELYRSNFNLLWDLYDYRIFQGMSMPIRDLFTEPGPSERLANGEVLAKVLYRLTNKLMELNDRNLQLGIIYALKVLLKAFNFFDFREVWMEFNFVEICFKFAYYNYVTALDLNCQNDLMEVTGTLIAGNVLTSNVISHSRFIDNLLAHTLKIINIYYHLFTNQKPLLFAKVQRNDLFANTKELAIVNSVGYFGNDYVYIKLYNILKSANDSYKMTINQVSGAKLMSLLRTCINTFSTCIELRVNCGDSSPSSNPIKLIEETIQYLTKLINYAPTECIASLRQLLKFLFGRNYGSRCNDYQHFINPYLAAKPTIAGTVGGCSANSSSTHFRTTSVYDNGVIGSGGGGGGGGIQTTNSTITTNSTVVFGQLFATGLEFPLWKTDWENDCAKYIKLFEPLVIYCLTLFMRSNARIQASILELLSQLLELNVTYSILDSKYLIFEEIMNNLELIETGVARNGTTIIPPVLKFLVQLTYKSDRKIITVPKIISIANNLLANNSIRECSVLALKGLAFEIFLMPATLSGSSTIEASQPHRPAPPPPTGVPARFPVSSSVTGASPLRLVNGSNTTNVQRSSINSITALDAKELETQKEVVLGMLEKFIDSQECQRMLAILLLQDRSWHSVVALQQQNLNQQQRKEDHSMDVSHQGVGSPTFQIMPLLLPSPTSSMQEGAIYSIVTKGLCDGKIKVHDWQGFFVLESLFQNSGKNILLDSKEFSSMLALFITKDVDSFSDLSCATIILENVILKTEEIYLVNHVKLYLKNHFDKCVVAGAGVRGSSAITTTQGMTLFELSGYPHLQSMSSSSSSSVGVLEHMVDAADYGSRYVSSLPSTSRAAASVAVATANITSTVTINEINYFAKVLCEKLDGCLATLAKCRTPPNRKYCGLVVRFVRALYAITEKREDSLQPAIRRLLSVEYNFWDRYNLNGLSTDEGLQLEMLKLFVAIKLQSDRTSVLQELQKDGIKWNVQRTLLREICLKLEEDLPATNWDCSELQQLFSRRFLNILIKDNLPSIRLLCEGNENVCSLFLRALIKNCDALNKSAIRRVVVQFIGKQDYNLMHCIDAQVELLMRLFDLAEGYGNKLLEGVIVRTSRRIIAEHDHKLAVRQNFLKIHNAKLKRMLFEEGIDAGADEAISRRCEQRIIDEKWLFTQVMKSSSSADPRRLSQILLEITSEYKLSKIFSSPEFDEQNILTSAIDTSLKSMLSSFRNNCIQFNPHIHYMNVNPLAKVAIATLMTRIDNYESLSHNNTKNLPLYLATAVISLMENLKHIEEVALIYIESKFIDKFIKEHLLRPELMVALKKFLQICCIHIKSCLMGQRPEAVDGALDMYTYSYCVDVMLKYSFIWNELNASSEEDEQHSSDAQLLSDVFNMLFAVVTQSMGNTIFYKKYKAKLLVATPQAVSVTQRAIFLAKLMETKLEVDERLRGAKTKGATVPMRILKSIGISILRTNRFYAYAVTPLEIYHQSGCTGAAAGVGAEGANLGGGGSNAAGGYESQIKSSNGKLPSIPVEHLSDADVLQKFVKRLSIFGFTTRQQFEEYFMTFLLLINKVYDENMVDVEEQFQIKSICLEAILELLITYKTFPIVGSKLSYFHHTTRWSRINCNSISLKKLHKVQLLVSDLNIFYHPNLERTLSVGDVGGKIKNNIIGTTSFQPNQYDLNFIWQQMEAYNSPSSPSRRDSGVSGDPALLSSTSGELAGRIVGGHSMTGADAREDVFARNFRHFTEHSGIDFRSSSQLIFDVLMQINEHNHVLALPNLVKFCEICDSRDQIKLIRDKALKFQETIPMDDTITHQYVIYLLCKTQAMLIPSPNELSHLCTLAAAYLKSSHVFIRNATLSGLLCLLECCSKTNTTIGKLSEELSMLRDLIVGYINRHGIIEESSSMHCHSDTHMKLVWTLNFSLIEWTAKFVTQCHLLSNTIIWANKFLKRTTNEDIYLCVLHGLERIIVINAATPEMRNKIEKLALDLMKLENERFSIPALKLLLSCMYMGSSKQLENTELSNGIVQDDPEIIAQQTDKVDILLHCIKSSTRSAAWIYGQVLCQIIRDLVPPNEILTKVIKEFLAINQPHCDVIASIVHQVFRSAIDSSFLQMLQDWLICSLPTFLALPQQKGVWALTVIFLSASINLHLIKLFPVVLVEFVELGQQEIALFQTSAQDFHSKLSGEQKARFRDAFKRFHQNEIFARMLHSL